jgi:hypothetical protein
MRRNSPGALPKMADGSAIKIIFPSLGAGFARA